MKPAPRNMYSEGLVRYEPEGPGCPVVPVAPVFELFLVYLGVLS